MYALVLCDREVGSLMLLMLSQEDTQFRWGNDLDSRLHDDFAKSIGGH